MRKPDFVTSELNLDLLPEKRIRTKWNVISGAPCSGKTTLIERFEAMGYRTVPETARQFIDGEFSRGRTIQELRGDEAAFQRRLLDVRLKVEQDLEPDEVLFLDRAMPEVITFYRAIGLDPNEILPECTLYTYASVFILDRLPLLKDGVRTEDDAVSDFHDEWLYRDYRALGYEVIRVSVMPVPDRIDFILGKLRLS